MMMPQTKADRLVRIGLGAAILVAAATGTLSARATQRSAATDSFFFNPAPPFGQAKPLARPLCQTTNESEVTITCKYAAMPRGASNGQSEQRLLLDRFAVSFEASDESQMRVSLTFTNDGASSISEVRTVYLAVDDDAGLNYIRRALPHVDLRKIGPGGSLTFSDSFLVGVMAPGHYFFHLWIPSPDQRLKFDSRYNLLLASEGVPDASSGLNTLAEYAVER